MASFRTSDIVLSAVLQKKGHLMLSWCVRYCALLTHMWLLIALHIDIVPISVLPVCLPACLTPRTHTLIHIYIHTHTHRKERFIVLSRDKVEYFLDSTMATRKGMILITDMSTVEGRIGSNHEHKFIIKTGKDELVVAATSPAQRDEWMGAIRKVIDYKVSDSNVRTKSPVAAGLPGLKQPSTAQSRNKSSHSRTVTTANSASDPSRCVTPVAAEASAPGASAATADAPVRVSAKRAVPADSQTAEAVPAAVPRKVSSPESAGAADTSARARTAAAGPAASQGGSPGASAAAAAEAAEETAVEDDGWEKVSGAAIHSKWIYFVFFGDSCFAVYVSQFSSHRITG
jgi:hypothetical protein